VGWGWIVLLAAVFALAHASRPGRRGLGLLVLLDMLLLGLGLELLFLWLGELWPLVLIHFRAQRLRGQDAGAS